MSKNEHWLLVFMALGANLKISIFDPPSVGGTYIFILINIYIWNNTFVQIYCKWQYNIPYNTKLSA